MQPRHNVRHRLLLYKGIHLGFKFSCNKTAAVIIEKKRLWWCTLKPNASTLCDKNDKNGNMSVRHKQSNCQMQS